MPLAVAMLPAWVVLPLAGLTMSLIAIHVLSVQMAPMPAWRKRLRIASGLLMMILAAMIAYALGILPVVDDPRVQPSQARAFVVLWTMIVAMLAIVVLLAIIDAYLTARQGIRAHRALRKHITGGESSSSGDAPE